MRNSYQWFQKFIEPIVQVVIDTWDPQDPDNPDNPNNPGEDVYASERVNQKLADAWNKIFTGAQEDDEIIYSI